MPTVSVIIPTYQRANLVTEAIETVFAQTYQDYEIIVVNDGSTDNTPELLAEFGDRIIPIHQENQGLSAARNAGIKASSGKYIAFLDDDDRWLPDKLAQQIPILETNPQVGLVYSDMFTCDSFGKILTQWSESNPTPEVKISWTLFQRNFIPVPTVVLRRICLDEVGLFDESLNACEDYDLWLRIIEKWPVYQISEPLAYYRIWAENMQKDTERMLTNCLRVKEKAWKRNLMLQRLPFSYLDKCYFSGYFHLTKLYLERNDKIKAAEVLKRYRQLRGYNISLESFQEQKNTAPPITMNLSKKFIFVHIPKTAGSSVIDALFPETRGCWGKYKGHYQPEEYTPEIWHSFFTFCFVRNPWDRMVSLYHYWCDGMIRKLDSSVSFKEFCLNLPNYVSNRYHLYQQVDFIYRNDQKIDFIGKVENLTEDFQFICDRLKITTTLPHLIPSNRKQDYRFYYDEKTSNFVTNYFTEDIKLGNYQFDSHGK